MTKGPVRSNALNKSITSGATSGVTSGGTSGSVTKSVDVKTEVGSDDIVSLMENDSQVGFQIDAFEASYWLIFITLRFNSLKVQPG